MDEREQQRINEAAAKFTSAPVKSFRAVSERGVAVQEQGARLTVNFFNRVVENLRTQAGDNRRMGQQLAEQQQRATEAGQTLTRESVDAYMEFVNSMFSFCPRGVEQTQRQTKRAQGESARTSAGAAPETDRTPAADLPIADYDSLNANEVIGRTEGLSAEELRRLRDYEAQTKNRRTVLERLDQRIEAGSAT